MEIGKGFLEHLKRTSEERSVHEFARAGESITSGFTHLRLRGAEGENVYFVWNGKKYYSFMSEDEMYKTLCGKTKEEYLQSEKVLKSLTEENRERDLKACKDARKYKFSDWSWEVTSSFPQEIAQLILKGTESSLGCGNTGTIERMDTMVQLLKIAREGTQIGRAHV